MRTPTATGMHHRNTPSDNVYNDVQGEQNGRGFARDGSGLSDVIERISDHVSNLSLNTIAGSVIAATSTYTAVCASKNNYRGAMLGLGTSMFVASMSGCIQTIRGNRNDVGLWLKVMFAIDCVAIYVHRNVTCEY